MTVQKIQFSLREHRLINAYHNENYLDNLPERRSAAIYLLVDFDNSPAEFWLLLDRDAATHRISAVVPFGGYGYGARNTETLRRLGIPADSAAAAMDELRKIVNDLLANRRTEEDQITEGLEGVKSEILNIYELDQHGARYDGAEFDPEDDFHQWLIENHFAEIETDDDDPAEKTISLAYDWRDRLSEYFGNYFLDVTIANNDEGTALCVEAWITTGGPSVSLRQFMGRGYELIYSWGALSESYGFDSELDAWLDDMLGTFSGEY